MPLDDLLTTFKKPFKGLLKPFNGFLKTFEGL